MLGNDFDKPLPIRWRTPIWEDVGPPKTEAGRVNGQEAARRCEAVYYLARTELQGDCVAKNGAKSINSIGIHDKLRSTRRGDVVEHKNRVCAVKMLCNTLTFWLSIAMLERM